MHVTAALQITEYSLINNSCMSVQTETQLRSDGGAVYYQLLEYSILNIPCMQKEFFLEDSAVTSSGFVSVMRPIHTCGFTGPQKKLHKEIYYVYSVCELYCLIAERAG